MSGRHAANDKAIRTGPAGIGRRGKAIVINRTGATRAVTHGSEEVTIAQQFLAAVLAAYRNGNAAVACEGVPERLIDLVANQLRQLRTRRTRRRRGLPEWTTDDVALALEYLAESGQIELPDFGHEGAEEPELVAG